MRKLAPATALIAALILAAIAGVGGTFAYLNASTTVPGSTIQAGTLSLRINGSATASLGPWALAPNAGQAIAFNVTSGNDAHSTITAAVTVSSTQLIKDYANLRIVEVANAGACNTSLTGGVFGALTAFPATTLTHLTAGETQWLCAVMTLQNSVPIARAGESISFAVTLAATQAAS
ncbi:hypothetical protein GCM10010401_12630 [Rarobacter faecitabidus]|uniref:SipW-dependent-type signal peptide-containing protein n=1 Tax=Rarobacter faecitabidus TaxID=13243 RepID=UPI001476A2BB|nr:SipW-dependent-type signal peptide-containing protein [Rarobacter faecitabidus]